jgi:hypothetical protein
MEPKDSLPFSQDPSTGPISEPNGYTYEQHVKLQFLYLTFAFLDRTMDHKIFRTKFGDRYTNLIYSNVCFK